MVGSSGPSAADGKPMHSPRGGKNVTRQTKRNKFPEKMAGTDATEMGTFPPSAVAAEFAKFQNSNPDAAAVRSNTVMTFPVVGFPNRRVGADSNDKVDTASAEGLKSAFKLAGGVFIFAVVWMVLGVAAFIMSLVCLSKKGSKGGQNVIGLLLAIFLGPLYWLYYIAGGSYCTNRIATGVGLEAA